jgi:hypothetical protein
MAGLRLDPDDYEFLDRLRRRRREPDPHTMAFLETLQAGVCQRRPEDLVDLVFTRDQVRAIHPNFSEDEAETVANYIAQLNSAIRPPTPYEGVFHRNVQLSAGRLDEAVARIGRWPHLTRPPLFALMEYGHLNARTVVAPTGDHIVLVDTELLQFLFLFSKAVAFAIPDAPPSRSGKLGFSAKPADVAAHLRRNREPLSRFVDVLLAYATTGRASSAAAYQVSPATLNLYSVFLGSAETFVLAHEYAHVLERHFDRFPDYFSGVSGGEVRQSLWSLGLESAADGVGLELVAVAKSDEGYDLTMHYWGVELFLHANEIALEAISLLRSGDEHSGLRQHERHLHASVNVRRTMLPRTLRNDLNRGLGEERAREVWAQIEGGLPMIRDVVDLLWQHAKPILVAAYRNGARTSPVWD